MSIAAQLTTSRPLCPSDISPASGGNPGGASKFGMLRLTLGESNACEVSARSGRTGAVNTNNGDQEV